MWVQQQEDFLARSGAASVSVMPPSGGVAGAAARGRRAAMSVNTSATLLLVLALVSQKNSPFSSAYACVRPGRSGETMVTPP